MVLKIIGGIYVVASLVTFIAYGIDKRRAIQQRRRIPEHRLHLGELLGGWPGGLIAQRVFHHKRRKSAYMFTFVGIILIHGVAWAVWFYIGRGGR